MKINENSTKVLKISCQSKNLKSLSHSEENKNEIEPKTSKISSSGISFKSKLKGLGLSLIGHKELLYFSLLDLDFSYSYETTISKLSKNNILMTDKTWVINFSLQNMQIDNFISQDMPVLFCPKYAYKELIMTPKNVQTMSIIEQKFKTVVKL